MEAADLMEQIVDAFADGEIETLSALDAPAHTLEELCDMFLPTLAARLWQTCCWPDRMTDGWKIGDFKFVVFSAHPEPRTELYIQFWSEPREAVLAEVCSGEWAPGCVKYVQEPQRRLLRSLGFRKGGEAHNFGRLIAIDSVAHAENAARDALRIFFAFGYRGQWPLEIRSDSGERAECLPVFSSLTPEDLAKLVVEHGYTAIVPEVDAMALVLLQRGRRRFSARLERRVPKQEVYTAIVLEAVLPPSRPLSDDALRALNGAIAGLTVGRGENRDLRLSMLLMLDGGVSERWPDTPAEAKAYESGTLNEVILRAIFPRFCHSVPSFLIDVHRPEVIDGRAVGRNVK